MLLLRDVDLATIEGCQQVIKHIKEVPELEAIQFLLDMDRYHLPSSISLLIPPKPGLWLSVIMAKDINTDTITWDGTEFDIEWYWNDKTNGGDSVTGRYKELHRVLLNDIDITEILSKISDDLAHGRIEENED